MNRNRQEKRVKIVLCGYYGHGNFGDEVILSLLKQKIKEICENPPRSRTVERTDGAAERTDGAAERTNGAAERTNGAAEDKFAPTACEIFVLNTKNPIKIAKMLRGADLFVFGGGSLLQDSTSVASLLYYIALIRLARRLARRTVMLANGIGPIK